MIYRNYSRFEPDVTFDDMVDRGIDPDGTEWISGIIYAYRFIKSNKEPEYAGYIEFVGYKESVKIKAMQVERYQRRKGVGRALVQRTEALLRTFGAKQIVGTIGFSGYGVTQRQHEVARMFWISMGYEVEEGSRAMIKYL